MVSKNKAFLAVYVLLESMMLVIQAVCLGSSYWTSWEFRYNMTLSNAENEEPPMILISGGHAGLWSRCVEIWSSWRQSNETENRSKKCFYNFDENGIETYGFGKVCKTATAAMCVLQIATNLVLLIIVVVRARLKRAITIWDQIRIPLFISQGIISVTAPMLYIVGNMAELVDHLTKVEVTAAYSLITMVEKEIWYIHDWAYWLQTSLLYLWIGCIYFYTELSRTKAWRLSNSAISARNGGSVELRELQEAAPLRTQ